MNTTLAIGNIFFVARRDSRGVGTRSLPDNPESPHLPWSMSMVTSIYLLPSVPTFRSLSSLLLLVSLAL
jgi:hypothetical protein